MFGFLNRPSLASGTAACIVGIMVIGIGATFAFTGLRGLLIDTEDATTIANAVAGSAMLLLGAALLGLGVRAVERFERKLLIHIASRGRVDS